MRVYWSGDADFPTPDVWDEFVSNAPGGHLLQSWAWGEFKQRFGWRPLRVAIAENGELLAAAQVLLRRLPYRCLAYVPRGPSFSPANEEANRALLSALHTVARRNRAIALKVEPHDLDTPDGEAWWIDNGFGRTSQTVQPRRTILVDLTPDEETILGRMKPKWRYNIRLAARKDVTVRQGTAADLPIFDDLMRETGERDGFAVHVPEYYRAAFELFQPGGHVALFLAEYQGEPLGALMAFAFGRQAIYMYGASSNRERARMPNHLLQWEAMRWAKARGCTTYDFWGIADTDPDAPSAGLSGVERFKGGFGGEVTRYLGAFDYTYSPLAYWAFNRLWSWRRARARQQQTPESSET